MKRIYLSLLPCLASLLASAQEPLNGDSLASDFRYLVKELAATHPDPYSGFGGKVFFYEQAFHLENELNNPNCLGYLKRESEFKCTILQSGRYAGLQSEPRKDYL